MRPEDLKITICNQTFPANRLPITKVGSDAMAYGTIVLQLPLVNATATAEVWQLQPPTTAEDRWIHIDPELYSHYPDILSYNVLLGTDGYYSIVWQFDPEMLPVVTPETFYSIEFFVNKIDDASVPQAMPKLILKIFDEII